MLEAYKNEIIQAEKDRNDLLKWKLILVAVLSAVSLGIGNTFTSTHPQAGSFSHFAVCLIPLVCVYVDVICKHLQKRILVISQFFQEYKMETGVKPECDLLIFHKYEKFCEANRPTFKFENWAQTGSTFVLCGLVICSAFLYRCKIFDMSVIIASGLTGFILTGIIDYHFKKSRMKLKQNKPENMTCL